MKLKDYFGKIVINKRTGQFNTSLKKKKLKEDGISEEDLFDIDIDLNLKGMLFKNK